MPYYYYGSYTTDSLYSLSVIILVAGLLISFFAQAKVKSNFNKYSKITAPLSGSQAARKLLESEGVFGVNIQRCSGQLTDHFDPRNNTIYLSENVYDTYSIAAVGIACHEAGHAVQYAHSYAPLKIRNAIIPVTKLGSSLAMPLFILGIAFGFYPLSFLGVIFFGAALFFQLITLPVEFNASARAGKAIRQGFFLSNDSDIKGISKILTCAALTYVAAMLVSLANFLRLFAIVNNRKR